LQKSLDLKLNRSKVENPWFVFGISYPGALSAWFRLKFPHLTCGSLASSAVVHAVYNFTEFDQQVKTILAPFFSFFFKAMFFLEPTNPPNEKRKRKKEELKLLFKNAVCLANSLLFAVR
jgi:hypothetical protein